MAGLILTEVVLVAVACQVLLDGRVQHAAHRRTLMAPAVRMVASASDDPDLHVRLEGGRQSSIENEWRRAHRLPRRGEAVTCRYMPLHAVTAAARGGCDGL